MQQQWREWPMALLAVNGTVYDRFPFGRSDGGMGIDMGLIRRFLVEYLIQVVGVGLAFWQAGISERIVPM